MNLYGRDSARRSLLDTIGFRALSQLATVVSYAVLVRSMTEHDFGVLSLFYSFIPIVITIGSLGLDHTLRRFQPEYLRTGQTGVAAWLVRVVRLTRFGSNLIIVLGILVAWKWVAPWFELDAYKADFAVFCVLILLFFQVNILQFSLASHMMHRYSVGSVAVVSAGKLVGYLVLSWLGTLSLVSAIVVDALSYGLAFVFLATAHRRACGLDSGSTIQRPDAEQLQRLKRYAGYTHFNDAAALLTYPETDRFFIAALMNPVAVGAYAFYTKLNEMLSNLVPLKLFDNVVQPLFFGVPKEEASEKIPRYFTLLINLNWVYQLPVIVFTVVYHREIVSLIFGGKFLEHTALLPVVVAFAASDNVISVPVTMVAQYKEKASIVLLSQGLGVYQVLAMLMLVPLIGLTGAAIATGTFHLFRNLFVWWQVRDVAIWMNYRSVLAYACGIWGLVIAVCILVKNLTDWPQLVDIFCGLAMCGLATLLYIRSPAVSDSDRRILANILHGREGRLFHWLGILHVP